MTSISPENQYRLARVWSVRHELRELVRDTMSLIRYATFFEVQGVYRLPTSSPVIFGIGPHNSHTDAPVARISLPLPHRRTTKFAAARDYFATHPMTNFISSIFLSSFLMERENPRQMINDINYAVNLLESGFSVGIFAEGTRHHNVQTPIHSRIFHDGIAALAIRTNGAIPIIPVLLTGLEEIMPRGKKIPRVIGQKIGVTYGNKLEIASIVKSAAAKHTKRKQITTLLHDKLSEMQLRHTALR